MKLSIALLAFAMSLPLFGCLEPMEVDGPDQEAVATTLSVVPAAGVTDTDLGAATNGEHIYWRCPGSSHNYLTSTSCALVCSTACRPVLVCTDNKGVPILCP